MTVRTSLQCCPGKNMGDRFLPLQRQQHQVSHILFSACLSTGVLTRRSRPSVDGAIRDIKGISVPGNAACLFTDLGPGQETSMVCQQSKTSVLSTRAQRVHPLIASHFHDRRERPG